MTAPMPLIRPTVSDSRTDLNDVRVRVHESCQNEHFVHKLREAEMEERYRKATFPQAQIDEAIEEIFAVWGA